MGKPRYERSLREYDYVEDLDEDFAEDDDAGLPKPFPTGTERRALPFTSSLLLVTRDDNGYCNNSALGGQ